MMTLPSGVSVLRQLKAGLSPLPAGLRQLKDLEIANADRAI